MRLIKWLLGIFLTLFVIVLLAVLILPRVIDPNDYRAQIASQASNVLGQEVQLNGDLSLSAFPWLGVDISDVRIKQTDAIITALPNVNDFLQVAQAQLRLKLMPLLSQRAEVDTIVLSKPKIHYVQLTEKQNSLSGFLNESAPPSDDKPNAQQTGQSGLNETNSDLKQSLVLVVKGIKIQDASIVYEDYASRNGQGKPDKYSLNEVNLSLGDLLTGNLVPLSLTANALAPMIYEHPIDLDFNAQVRMDKASFDLELEDISLDVKSLEQEPQTLGLEIESLLLSQQTRNVDLRKLSLELDAILPSESQDAQIIRSTSQLEQLQMQLDSQTLSPTSLSLTSLNSTLRALDQDVEISIPTLLANLIEGAVNVPSLGAQTGELAAKVSNLKVTDLFNSPKLRGALSVDEFNLAKLLNELDVEYSPEPPALQSVSINTEFDLGLDSVGLKQIQASLDQTTFSGSLSLRDFAQPEAQFNLQTNGIDADAYLPKTDQAGATASSESQTSTGESLVLPLALFKQFKANGRLQADYLVFNGTRMDNIDVQVTSKGDRLTIVPKAKLYEGAIGGEIVYSEPQGEPRLSIKQSIDLVSLGGFLADAGITDQLSGIGSLDIDLTVFEKAGEQFNRGTIKLMAKNGALKGIDIKKVLNNARQQYDQLRGKEVKSGEFSENDETRFAELLGTIEIDNFNLKNRDFSLKAPLFRINGSGDIDILNQSLNYLTKISVVNSSQGQGGEELAKLKGITLPVRFSGSIGSPKFSIDMKELYKIAAERKIEEKKAQLVQQKLGIENGGGLSTKDIFRAAASKKIDQKYGTGQPQNNTQATQGSGNNNASSESVADGNNAQAASGLEDQNEPAQEQTKEQAKDQLKDDVKNLILDGIFGR